jgi:hypothetical protein
MTVAIFACQISEVREDVGDDQDAAPAGAALAGLRSALEGKLSSELDAQVLVPRPAGNAQKGALRSFAGRSSTEVSAKNRGIVSGQSNGVMSFSRLATSDA